MKKALIILLAAACLLTFASCGSSGRGADRDGAESVRSYNDTEWLNEVPNISDLDTMDFEAQYIRNGAGEDVNYPAVKVIRSVKELNQYQKKLKYLSDELEEAFSKYDDSYFAKRPLLIVLLEEGSGSIRHEVKRVGYDSGSTVVEIDSIVPEVGTCDMAYWHILIEPENAEKVSDEDKAVLILDGINATQDVIIASHSLGYGNISLMLKDGWSYTVEEDSEREEFSLIIYPDEQPEAKIRIGYYNGFGVCGTGLTQETIMLGSYEAWMGTYDNSNVWDFISLTGLPGDYAILNEGADKWWSEYGEEAMQILATIKVADGYIDSSEAIKIARDKLNEDFDEVNTTFSRKDGIWTVTMTRNEGLNHYVMTVKVDIYGNIQEMYNPDEIVCAEKPVIYLYPTEETDVTVKLNLNGDLTTTYPAYNNGWTVTASPDGTLRDDSGREYYCLFWEGESDVRYDFSKGFCVKGKDTAKFFENTLAKLGLTEKEANEFIIYWLPQMERNAYNLISFQTDAYTNAAVLDITPTPDSLLRVFMTYKPLTEAVEIEPQEFTAFERNGFTVVEWGGSVVK